jgi:hypothetical protein
MYLENIIKHSKRGAGEDEIVAKAGVDLTFIDYAQLAYMWSS